MPSTLPPPRASDTESPDGTPPVPGGQRSPGLIAVAIGAAVILGLAAAGGSFLAEDGTQAEPADAWPYALVGASLATALGVIACLVVYLQSKRRPRWPIVIGVLALLAAAGALIGAAFTPETPDPQDTSPLPDEVIEEREEAVDDLGDQAVVRPLDTDGDGEPDLDADGNPRLGLDTDGDGTIDELLAPCPDRTVEVALSAPSAAPRAIVTGAAPPGGLIPYDADCDGTVDRLLPFDESTAPFVPEFAEPPAPLPTVPPSERAERAAEQGASGQFGGFIRNALIVLGVAVALATVVWWWLNRRSRSDDDDDADDARMPPPTEPGISHTVNRSLDALRADVDPRRGIIDAYRILLDGLAARGLGRLPHEGPEEHLRRCLAAEGIPETPARELVTLFEVARFSRAPVTEQDRARAMAALHATLPPTQPPTPVPANGEHPFQANGRS